MTRILKNSPLLYHVKGTRSALRYVRRALFV